MSYSVQVSNDATNWNTVYSETSSEGGKELLADLDADGRYVRILLEERTTEFGFSLYEVEVYGSENTVTGISSFESKSLTLYPNPAHNKVVVLGADNSTWTIYSLQGEELLQGNSSEINIETLAIGTYILSADNQKTKLVKN